MPNRRVIFIVMAYTLALILFASNAKAADKPLPDGWTCEAVRDAVRQHGKVLAYAAALAHGVSPKQIKEIRQRCKV